MPDAAIPAIYCGHQMPGAKRRELLLEDRTDLNRGNATVFGKHFRFIRGAL